MTAAAPAEQRDLWELERPAEAGDVVGPDIESPARRVIAAVAAALAPLVEVDR